MRVFASMDFPGHRVGTAAVVIAEDVAQATELLLLHAKLVGMGLAPPDFTIHELDLSTPKVVILCGDY